MLTIVALVGIFAGVYGLCVHILEIEDVTVHDVLLIIAIAGLALYRLVDRWPPALDQVNADKEEDAGLPVSPRRRVATAIYRKNIQKNTIRWWCRKEQEQLFDYFNIWNIVRERKRDRLASSLIEPHMSTQQLDDVYEVADRALGVADRLRSTEMAERINKNKS